MAANRYKSFGARSGLYGDSVRRPVPNESGVCEGGYTIHMLFDPRIKEERECSAWELALTKKRRRPKSQVLKH